MLSVDGGTRPLALPIPDGLTGRLGHSIRDTAHNCHARNAIPTPCRPLRILAREHASRTFGQNASGRMRRLVYTNGSRTGVPCRSRSLTLLTNRQPTTMNDNLASVTRNLHDLLKALPAVRERCEAEVLRRHLALIAHYQRLYDRLVA